MSLTKVDTSMIVGNLPATRIDGAPVNVINYGAVGDGITDDTVAIQNALNAAEGKLLLIPEGTYMINDTGLTVPGRCVIMGAGATTILKKTTNTSGSYAVITFPSGAGGSTMSNLTIEGDWESHVASTGEYGHCVVVSGANVTIRDCLMESGWGDGIYINASDSVTVDNCKVQFNRRNNISIIKGQNHSVVNSMILKAGRRKSDNVIGTSPRAGIDIEPNSGDTLDRVTINACRLLLNDAAGINVTGAFTQRDTIISNCFFSQNGYGIETSFSPINTVISGCTFSNVGTAAVCKGIRMSAGTTEIINVTGCTFDSLGDNGIFGTACEGAVITGCVFTNSTAEGVLIDTANPTSRVDITGCYFNGSTNAVNLENFPNGNISSNTFEEIENRAITLRDCSEIFVTSNKFKKCGNSGTAAETVYLDNATATPLNIITNNFLFNEDGVYPTYFVNQRFGTAGAKSYVANNILPASVTEQQNCVAISFTWGTSIPDTY